MKRSKMRLDNDNEALKIKSYYEEAIKALEDVSRFLEYKGYGQETLCVSSFIDTIVTLKINLHNKLHWRVS